MKRIPDATSFAQLLSQRLTRRRVLAAGAAIAPLAVASTGLLGACTSLRPASKLAFKAIEGSKADAVVLPPGYRYDLLVRWGDSLWSSTPDLDAARLADGVLLEPGAAERQQRQFGTNCDAIHFFPLDARGERGILCVNNEFTLDELMYPQHRGITGALRGENRDFLGKYPHAVAVSKAAQGVSVLEIVRSGGRWQMVKDSRFNRRITAETPIDIGGPARGSALLRTADDPEGVRVLGTFGNCAGGETPWGTYLTAEENIQDYFGNLEQLKARSDVDPHVVESHRRWRMWKTHSLYSWEAVDARFDLPRTPNEPLRFGWIVEIDPREPTRPPVKRTALGRFAHEGASPFVARDGRVAVYMGDDDKFEHIYKFVSDGRFDPKNPAANRDLLDRGTLYVARLDDSGRGQWLPLVFDPQGPLNPAAGFRDQAEVVIKARAAATVLGATAMDRTEDMDVNPVSGRIYVACTRNENRTAKAGRIMYAGREVDSGIDRANPRGANPFGHIIEIHEANDDHTAREFSWEVFLLAGDPAGGRLVTDLTQVRQDSTYYAGYGNADELSPIGSPDNVGFDRDGNLWIVSDGPQPRGANDGCWVCPTEGPQRGRLQQFMSGPFGAEICGCQFTPDCETLFLSIQHPGEGGSVAEPRSHWPDGPGTQPRSSVIAVTREGGGTIGS
ncbi:MAG TPA: PhoX family phosphatase [Steroidobacteraceae bacterium]|nr:PhoX family phosphatase [Steroidobacteraceae bacterium]